MDTLVFLCQHTCTMVLPRWGVGLSSELCDAAMSSSDSTSTVESSGHSGKVRRLLLLDNELADEGRGALKHRQCQYIHKSNIVLCSWDFSLCCFYSVILLWVMGMAMLYFLTITVNLLPISTFCQTALQTEVNISYSAVCSCSDLLLSVRLLVRRLGEGPLLVLAVSIATFMSSIHFSISVSELERKMHKWSKCIIRQSSQREVTSWIHVGPSVLPTILITSKSHHLLFDGNWISTMLVRRQDSRYLLFLFVVNKQ